MKMFQNNSIFHLAMLLAVAILPGSIVAKTILGVDLGSLYMKVALVQRNSPLEIVTNLHSKRKTEQIVLFDQGTRFYGSDASSLFARKPTKSPQAMSVALGRTDDHPATKVLAERHYPIVPSYNETRSGVCLTIDGETFTPEELVAMVLTHAKDITSAFGVKGDVKDCVLTVPSFSTQHERRALLDAAKLAGLNVLALIDENTAAGLHYGIDLIEEEPQNMLFYNMGASSLQVSVMQFYSYERKETKYGKGKKVGAFQVLGKAWDSSVGGSAFDARIVDYMADEFNEIWNKKRNDGEAKDVRIFPRPMAKLRIQANKVKHVLSANNDFPVFIDSLHDNTNYHSHMSRATFEEICHDLLERSTAPIEEALKAANMTLSDIHGVELIGGGMRVPMVQEGLKDSLGDGLDLGMHINSDESMALGAAFHGANVSTAFKVRHVGMTDINPFPVIVNLENLPESSKTGLFGLGKKKDNDDDDEVWSKHATIFKENGKIGVKKTIAFTHDSDVACAVDYDEESYFLPEGTPSAIERYNITGVAAFAKEMADKGLAKPKVSLQFELSTSGLVHLVKAEASVEETYTVEEEEEVDDEEAQAEEDAKEEKAKAEEDAKEEEAKTEEVKDDAAEEETKEEVKDDAAEEETKEEVKDDAAEEETKGDSTEEKAEEKKEEKPKKKKKMTKTIKVQKEKKRMLVRKLTVGSYHVGPIQPYNEFTMEESVAKMADLAKKDKDRMMLEEIKNTHESYIYLIKNKLIDFEKEIAAVSTQEQRDALSKSAEEHEEWMYDEGYDADLETYTKKYNELSAPGEKMFSRMKEVGARDEAVTEMNKKLEKVAALMKKWETTMPQVTEEERADIISKADDVKKWIAEKVEAQAAADPSTDPVFTSSEVPLQTTELQAAISKLSRRPKPAPKKEEKEEKKNETDTESGESGTEEKEDDSSEESKEEPKEEEKEEEEDAAPSEDKEGEEL
eukprot:CAMPEP_0194125220 /NCGR_PEP_ID=MMETSP0150-20130528/59348_1 /TAXON_ID=122233 /ORGANISM="Chaetoceros debilis, Strain MM31A-1" /LENGTH=964 /DNA_ID=CAMNT_0038819017 /DNA_START=201 /DNA_END=3095 /DNA_ORIENTATION=+